MAKKQQKYPKVATETCFRWECMYCHISGNNAAFGFCCDSLNLVKFNLGKLICSLNMYVYSQAIAVANVAGFSADFAILRVHKS